MPDNFENPYESPQTEVGAVKPLSERILTENMLFYLKGASPWLRFVGIVGFIGLGLAAVYFLTMIIAFQNTAGAIPGFENMGALGASVLLAILLIYEGLMFFPIFFTFQFGRKIRTYLHSGEDADLEQAFKSNKALWTYNGVLVMIGGGITVITILVAIVALIASAAF
jgi:hypothetical protein